MKIVKGKKTSTASLGFVLVLGAFLIGQIVLLTIEGKNVLDVFFDPAYFLFNFTYFAFFLVVTLAVSFTYRR